MEANCLIVLQIRALTKYCQFVQWTNKRTSLKCAYHTLFIPKRVGKFKVGRFVVILQLRVLAGKIRVSRMSLLQKEMFGDVLVGFGEQRNMINVVSLFYPITFIMTCRRPLDKRQEVATDSCQMK